MRRCTACSIDTASSARRSPSTRPSPDACSGAIRRAPPRPWRLTLTRRTGASWAPCKPGPDRPPGGASGETERRTFASNGSRRTGGALMSDPISYASGTSSVPLLGETIDANLRRAVSRFPEREALVAVSASRRFTYAELDAAVDELARALLARGIAKGDRVGVWAPNRYEWFV